MKPWGAAGVIVCVAALAIFFRLGASPGETVPAPRRVAPPVQAVEPADLRTASIDPPSAAAMPVGVPTAGEALKGRLLAEQDVRAKWELLCQLAICPETESLFRTVAERRKLDAVIVEVCEAIRRGELQDPEEEP